VASSDSDDEKKYYVRFIQKNCTWCSRVRNVKRQTTWACSKEECKYTYYCADHPDKKRTCFSNHVEFGIPRKAQWNEAKHYHMVKH
jgi:hypothetical protein